MYVLEVRRCATGLLLEAAGGRGPVLRRTRESLPDQHLEWRPRVWQQQRQYLADGSERVSCSRLVGGHSDKSTQLLPGSLPYPCRGVACRPTKQGQAHQAWGLLGGSVPAVLEIQVVQAVLVSAAAETSRRAARPRKRPIPELPVTGSRGHFLLRPGAGRESRRLLHPRMNESRSLLGTGMDGTGGRDMMEIRCGNEKKKGIGTHEYPGNIGVGGPDPGNLLPSLDVPPGPLPTPLPTYHQPTHPGPSVPTHAAARASRDIQPDHHRLSGKGRDGHPKRSAIPPTLPTSIPFFHTYTKGQHATHPPPPTPFPHLGPPPAWHHPPPCLV